MKLRIVTDASCHRTDHFYKGQSTGGALFYDANTGELLREEKFALGEMTPFEAERRTILFALDIASEMTRGEIQVWTDAQHVVRHMAGDYLLRRETSKRFFDEAKRLELRFKKVEYFHQDRGTEAARTAHSLAAQAYMESRQ